MKISRNRIAKFAKMAAIMAAALLLASCASVPPMSDLPTSPPDAFSRSGAEAMPEHWWEAFDDPQLTGLINEALTGSFTVAAARDRLVQARAVARKSGAALWPDVDGSAGVDRTVLRSSQSGRGYSTEFGLGLSAGYEVDLWGRVRAERDAAAFSALATAEDLATARLTVSAAVARTWFSILDLRWRLELLDEQIGTNEKYLSIIDRQFRSGQAAITDVLQQRQVLEARRGRRELILASLQIARNELAVLVGRMPGDLDLVEADRLPNLPPLPSTGIPLETLTRRPDVRAAAWRLASADRGLAAAVADRLPQLRLGVSAQTTSEELRDLFDNWLANVAASLTAPLFDAGLRRAEVERARAESSERLNDYAQVLLESVQEVEDALETERRQAAYGASLERQVDLADTSLRQTLGRYVKGDMTFTRYLTALLDYQALQFDAVEARRDTLFARIDLYRALAGDAVAHQSHPDQTDQTDPADQTDQ